MPCIISVGEGGKQGNVLSPLCPPPLKRLCHERGTALCSAVYLGVGAGEGVNRVPGGAPWSPGCPGCRCRVQQTCLLASEAKTHTSTAEAAAVTVATQA